MHTNAASTVLAAQADDVLGLGPFLDLLGASREPERLAQQPVRTPAKKTAGATKAATKKVAAAAAATKKSPAPRTGTGASSSRSRVRRRPRWR